MNFTAKDDWGGDVLLMLVLYILFTFIWINMATYTNWNSRFPILAKSYSNHPSRFTTKKAFAVTLLW